MYKLIRGAADATLVMRLADGAVIPRDEANTDYQQFLAWEADGGEAQPADPVVEPGPTRDERLLAAVDGAKTDVAEAVKAGVFTQQQATALASVFDKLGQAITGGGT